MPATPVQEVQTARGVARLHVDGDLCGGLLVLGHGAGGGVEATDYAFAVRRGDPAAAPQIESLVRNWLLQLP